MWNKAMWVGPPRSEIQRNNILHGDMTGRFAYFRLNFDLATAGSLILDISANSRYRLWVNGVSAVSGPCKGDLHRHYFETVDVTRYLHPGENILAAQVLYMDHYASVHQQDERAGIQSVLTPGGGHRLAVEGVVRSEAGTILADVTTGRADWRVFLDGSRYLTSGEVTSCLGAVMERVDFSKVPSHWKNADFDISGWVRPEDLETVCCNDFMRTAGLLQRFPLRERPMTGIRFEDGQLIVKPDLSYLPDLRGRFMTPMGPVNFDYRRRDGRQVCDLTLPALAVVHVIESNDSVVTVRRSCIIVVQTVEPDPELTSRYEERYSKFKIIYPALKSVFSTLN